MAEGSDKIEAPEQADRPRECMACRATGQVISKLAGETSLVTCPWCDGSGVRTPGIDAQSRWPRETAPGQGDGAPREAPQPSGEPSTGS